MTTQALLDLLLGRRVIDTLDRQFALALADLAEGRDAEDLALLAALVSAARRAGHSCVAYAEVAGTPFPDETETGSGLPVLPDLRRCHAVARRHPELLAVDPAGAMAPLCLTTDGRLYLWRYLQAEERIRALVAQPRPSVPPTETEARILRGLFPEGDAVPDWQAVAALTVLSNRAAGNRLSIVTGGPGTGKTTTVARILAAVCMADPACTIALAAPTSKAARRLADSLSEQVLSARQGVPSRGLESVSLAVLDALPTQASTVHALLGYHPGSSRCHHHARRRLPYDLVVIDEASMLEILLADGVLRALPDRGHLLLIGDKDQLASVETGYVLGDLCQAVAGRGVAPAIGTACQQVFGWEPPVDPLAPALAGGIAELRRGYRFAGDSALAAFATALRDGMVATWTAILDDQHDDLVLEDDRPLDDLPVLLADQLAAVRDAPDPATALARLTAVQIICPRREGSRGVTAVNRVLDRHGAGEGQGMWYHGRPVMITANDHQLGLANGSVGICWQDAGAGTLRVFFADPDLPAGVRGYAPAQLRDCIGAWAITVHKSQGSEYDTVLVILPEEPSRLMTRELVYTALTRARRRCIFRGHRASLLQAVATVTRRHSGLVSIPADA